MENSIAAAAFGALAYPHRLRIFRLLINSSAEGLAAGEIAERLDIPASSLSFHLSILQKAGLISSERRQRQINYSTNI
ncbi:MAG: metalloregulator ArsR/SmtB family transcription factor [Maricaulis sp.]|jgi:ArsR family transcriptional regulator|nr:metalloregulator ArsR/SmtB family transcription factor [Maricaulis sp.]